MSKPRQKEGAPSESSVGAAEHTAPPSGVARPPAAVAIAPPRHENRSSGAAGEPAGLRSPALRGARLRYLLSLVLIALSLGATLHFARIYALQRLYLGLLATVVLGLLCGIGAASFAAARRRLRWELRALALPSPPAGSLAGRRAADLAALRARGGRPDLTVLAQAAAAEITGGAYLGRYFVGVAVLVGLLGTFAGLMETLGGVAELLRRDNGQAGQSIQSVLQVLSAPLAGLNVTFGASMVGILVTVTLTLLQGDLMLLDEHLLSALEEHTAHQIVPGLWPAQGEAAAQLRDEVLALRGELRGGGQRFVAATQEALAQALAQADVRAQEAAARTLAQEARAAAAIQGLAQELQGQTSTTLRAITEALLRHAAEGADHLDTRLRQGNELLSAQARRTAALLEESVRRLADEEAERAERRAVAEQERQRALFLGLDERLERLVAHAKSDGERVREGISAALHESARTVTQAAARSCDVAQAASREAAQAASAASQEAAQAASAASQEAAQAARAALGGVTQQAAQALGGVTQQAAQALGGVTQQATQALDGVTQQATQVLTGVQERSAALLGQASAEARALASAVTGYARALQQAEEQRTRALLDSERERQAAHAQLLARLQALLDEGIARPVTEHLSAWQAAAREAREASQASAQAMGSGAAALTEAAQRFTAGSAALLPPLTTLAPELNALSAELALLAARAHEDSSPQLLLELARLSDSVERLTQHLGEG